MNNKIIQPQIKRLKVENLKIILTILLSFFIIFTLDAQVKVKGYFRKDGTYVKSHYRSLPDGNPYNNWSYPGNTNPYTGKTAIGNPDTYIKNYYNKDSNLYSNDIWVDGYYRNDGTIVRGHYRSAPDGNPYNNWSYPGNTNPYTGKTATGNPDTYISNYYSKNTSSNVSYETCYVIAKNALNVRSGPSTEYSIITTLSYGESVKAIETDNPSWKRIMFRLFEPNSSTYKYVTGYLSSLYLSSTPVR